MPNILDLATGRVKVAPTPNLTGNTLTLQNGEGELFPEADFYVTAHRDNVIPTRFNAEILYVTERVGDTLTIERAKRDTTAKSIIVGWRVSNSLYREDLEELRDKNYILYFINTDTVIVNHNLGKRPAVTVLDSAEEEVEGEVEHLTDQTLVVRFSSNFSGTVICN